MPAHRILLTGGHVLSMDPEIGELDDGGVLIEYDRILAVGPGLDGADAEVIDADGGVRLAGRFHPDVAKAGVQRLQPLGDAGQVEVTTLRGRCGWRGCGDVHSIEADCVSRAISLSIVKARGPRAASSAWIESVSRTSARLESPVNVPKSSAPSFSRYSNGTSESEIEIIRKFLHEFDDVEVTETRLTVKANVRIKQGVLMNFKGLVLELIGNKARVRIDSMGMQLSAVFEKKNLEILPY